MITRCRTLALMALVFLTGWAEAHGPSPVRGLDTGGMDGSVQPGNDFYLFANGAWMQRTAIPADQGREAAFLQMQRRVTDRVRQILEASERKRGDKLGDFYASFMDTSKIDKRGLSALDAELDALRAVKNKDDLALLMGRLQREGVDGLFTVPRGMSQLVEPDDKEPTAEISHLRQGGLGLPDRDYYVSSKASTQKARDAYVEYIATLFTLAGGSDIDARARRVFALEDRIARVHWDRVDSRDADRVYNRWAPREFGRKAPGLPWALYLEALGLQDQPAILVAQPSAFIGEATIWSSTPLDVLKDHQLIELLDHYAPYLAEPFANAAFAFHGRALQGLTEQPTRSRRGVELVSVLMRDAVGKEYVRRYFPPATEAAVREIVRNVVAAWHDRLDHVGWMNEKTRAAANHKLDAMLELVGHTTHWRNYDALSVQRSDLVGNVRRACEQEFNHQLGKLAAPTERDDWAMAAMNADAFEDPVKNTIILPAGIFQPPYFDVRADPAVNYGALGAFVGHEISHAFDDQGRKYDATGRLADWWTPEDVRGYADRTAGLVKQYDDYQPLPGQHIQGAMVLGETMADLGGIVVAHRAYELSLGSKNPPTVGGLTADQRFYLGWAQMWRMKYRDEALLQQLLSDPHPPGEYRADIVRNQTGWYDAFAVRPGDRLYLDPAHRVQIW